MIKIGLSGNIASGKSTVEKIIKSLGIKVIDADEVCRKLLLENESIKKNVKNIFYKFNIEENDKLNLKRIAQIIFSDCIMKKKLENLLHPIIVEEIDKFFDDNIEENVAIASIPLLFEANLEKKFDKIILITAPLNIRLQRLIKRNKISIKEGKKMIFSQKIQEEKVNLSDFVVSNDTTIEDLEKKVKKVISEILKFKNY